MKKRFEPIASKCGEIVEFIMGCDEIPEDPSLEFKIRLCCEEAVQNVVDYAYEGGAGYLETSVEKNGQMLEFNFKDSGTPFNPLEKKDPDVTATIEERPIGGLGIFLCKQMMDDILYEYKDGCNVLTMKLKIQ